MCDTFIADFSRQAGGYKVFGKNSDREPNEAQAIVRYPHMQHTEKTVQTTFIAIPQAAETYEVILSKPFQMWGAEMGANEHGVVIGNEAVFTRLPFRKDNSGLTGMDMLRLALERSDSARHALDCITALLETYGQDACGGYRDRKFYYHNSFIIADGQEQYILETAGKHWVAKAVQGYAAISNGLSIGEDYDLCSDSVRKLGNIHFARRFRDRFMSYFARCDYRREHSLSHAGKVGAGGVREAMYVLRSHGDAEPFRPEKANMEALCIHAQGLFTPHQTTGSMVVQWRDNAPMTVWLTGTAAPCVSVFKPFYFGGDALAGDGIHIPTGDADNSLWWQGERLHRILLRDYAGLSGELKADLMEMEQKLIRRDAELTENHAEINRLDALSADALQQHMELLQEFLNRHAGLMSGKYPGSWLYRRFRKRLDREAKLSI